MPHSTDPTGTPITASTTPSDTARRNGAAVDLTRYAWLSIATAILTIALKATAWVLTGSVGLLSDAAESTVNLVAAVVALIALRVAITPATDKFMFGRAKSEYFAAAVEGVMIFVAATVILFASVERFINPQPLENLGIGLLILVAASILNLVVALVLIRAGTKHRSITLRADGKHLMTDVITSAGVLIGIGLVAVTGWERLDPVIAFLVGVNIIITGTRLLHEAISGLLDKALPEEDHDTLRAILRRRTEEEHVDFHGLQTREAGQQKFMNVHVLVPDDWTVKHGHDYIEELEEELTTALPALTVHTHLEPISDPASYEDIPEAHIPIYDEESATTPPPDRP